MLNQEVAKTVKGYWALSDSFLNIAGKPLDLNIIQIYATLTSSDEDIEQYYEDLEQAGPSYHGRFYCKNRRKRRKCSRTPWTEH